jgi:hypothetical protein
VLKSYFAGIFSVREKGKRKGSRSGKPKDMRIRIRIRIPNTAGYEGGRKTVHAIFKYMSTGPVSRSFLNKGTWGGLSNASPSHPNPISQLILG